ncbi:MAG: hypothetical protein V1927_01580 [Candidatus Omnitrophota bacterium]
MRIQRGGAAIKTILLVLFLIFAAGCVFFNISDVDIGFHIKTGELIAKERGIPTRNTFSFTMPDHTWALHQWAGAFTWYLANLYGGYKGIIMLRVLVFLLTIGALFLTLNIIDKNYFFFKLILLTVFALLVRHHFFERPFIFSALFLAILQYLVLRDKFRDDAKWLILLLFIVWVQMHAGFIYGILFLALAAVIPRPSRVPAFAAAGLIAGVWILITINPNGINGILFALNCLFEPLYSRIVAEYQVSNIITYKLFYATLFSAIVLAAVNRERLGTGNILIFSAFSVLAVKTNRNILFYAIVAIPILFDLGIATIKKFPAAARAISKGLVKYALLVALWAGLLAFVVIPDKVYCFGFGFYKPFYPSEIFDFIKKNKPRGNIFNDMPLGGPMIWFLYPDYRVFIDGRFEAYDKAEFWIDDYFHILTTKKGWEDKLNKYNVTMCLLSYGPGEKEDFIGRVLQNSRDWRIVAFDGYTALFMKDTPENHDIILKVSRDR